MIRYFDLKLEQTEKVFQSGKVLPLKCINKKATQGAWVASKKPVLIQAT